MPLRALRRTGGCFAVINGGLVSLLASLALVTPAQADRYLSPSGRDAGACDVPAAPCRTPDYAYRQAQPGEAVQLAGGSYGRVVLERDPAKTSDADVTFQPAPGAQVVFNGLEFGRNYDAVGAAHVTVAGVTVTPWANFRRTEDVTLRGVTIKGGVTAEGAKDLAFFGGSWGDPSVTKTGDHPEFKAWRRPGTEVIPDGLTVDGVFIHDILRPDAATHTNCLHPQDGTRIVIRNNRFHNCDVFGVLINPNTPVRDVLIENNLFEPSTNILGQGRSYYSLMLAPESATITDVTIRNNTFAQAWVIDRNQSTLTGRVVGNVGSNNGCYGSMSYSRNLWTDRSRCGSTDRVVRDVRWGGDYRLLPGSPAIDAADAADFPATDADGRRRPAGGGPDAGAFEFGADSDPPSSSSAPPTAAMRAVLAKRGRVRMSRTGLVRTFVRCPRVGGAACKGRVTLKRGSRSLGTKLFVVPADGRAHKVIVRVSRGTRRRVRARGSLQVSVVVRMDGVVTKFPGALVLRR